MSMELKYEGAILALNKVLSIVNIVDPEDKDEKIKIIKEAVIRYRNYYENSIAYNKEHPFRDDTWRNIQEANNAYQPNNKE